MFIVVASLDGLKKSEIEMKPNQAYEMVARPQPAIQVNVEPDYEDVAQVHYWIWMYTTVFECRYLIMEMILPMYRNIDLSTTWNFIEFFCAMA